ncbi:hypothetical protein AAY473_017281 [Plecturocebus cupreus]
MVLRQPWGPPGLQRAAPTEVTLTSVTEQGRAVTDTPEWLWQSALALVISLRLIAQVGAFDLNANSSLKIVTKLAEHSVSSLLSQHSGRPRQVDHLRRLRQENHLNLGGGGCSEPQLHRCTPAGAIRERLPLNK